MLAVTEQSEIQNSLVVRDKDQIQGHALYNIFMESKKKSPYEIPYFNLC